MKYEVRINPEVLPESTAPDRVLRYIDIGNVDSFGRVLGVEEMRFEDAPSRARRIPRLGDSIIATVRTYLRAIAYISEDDPSMVCSTGFAVVRPGKRLDSKYLFYWLRSDPVVDEICARSVGVSYPAFNGPELGALPVPLVPLDQQRRIADFLDRKTASIDTLIEKQEQLLALLAEKRQALITQAVTKGLDPNVPMKDSGVEWIGSIPSHWTMQALRYRLRRIEQGWSPACENREAEEDEWGVLKVGCVNYGRFRESENKALPADLAPLPEYEVRVGDVLVSRANTRELVGSAAFVHATRKRLLLCDKLFRLHYCPSVNPQFLVLLLQSAACRHQLEADATGASGSMQNIGQDSIRGLLFAWPPLDEQHWIVEHVQKELQRLDALSQRVQAMIEKLREYRQALITAAVTGQLDVTTIEAEQATNVVEAATA